MTFKIGDRVQVRATGSVFHGKKGEIVDGPNAIGGYGVSLEGGPALMWFDASELVLVTATRLADADLGPWVHTSAEMVAACREVDGRPVVREVVRGVVHRDGMHCTVIVPPGFKPGSGEKCRSATRWPSGWMCFEPDGDYVFTGTESQAIAWVLDGVLP